MRSGRVLSDVLRRAGFTQEGGPGDTWTRPAGSLVHVVAATDGTADRSLVAGVWSGDLEVVLHRSREADRPLALSRCHLLFPGHPLSDDTATRACVDELDALQTLDDLASVLRTPTTTYTWPPSPDVRDLYLAGIAVLTGAPTVLEQAQNVAARLVGTEWSAAANHIYAMVATAE